MTERQPNLLFIYADQHRADVLGSAGNDVVVTPHLDWLAAEGVRFEHAWTESPICQPARASMLTGRYPSDHGFLGNFASVCRPEWDTYPRRLQEAGYTTATIGTPLRTQRLTIRWAETPIKADKLAVAYPRRLSGLGVTCGVIRARILVRSV